MNLVVMLKRLATVMVFLLLCLALITGITDLI